jgi:hydrogenase maturation protein HypF
VRGILADLKSGIPIGLISAKFHNTLAEVIVAVAGRVGVPQVVLSGGCFQNRYLTERTVARLGQAGFRPYWHQRIPPNDGGIAFGQIIAAHMGLKEAMDI